VGTVLLLAPLLHGSILQFEERVQRARGPDIFQPYRDLWKLFQKQIVVPQTASWVFWAAPVTAITCMLTVPILIPVLTNFLLPLSDMGDILGGGLILTLGSFVIILAGLDTASAYGGIGSSRAAMVSILAEPTLILVFVGITLLAKAMLPFVVDHLLVASWAVYWSLAHLFLVATFFILLLVETDRMPIHSSTHIEVYMIDEGRILEYSGPMLALLKWASTMKQFILYTIFCNVLILPWGLSIAGTALGAAWAAVGLIVKFVLVAGVVVFVETVQSQLASRRAQREPGAGLGHTVGCPAQHGDDRDRAISRHHAGGEHRHPATARIGCPGRIVAADRRAVHRPAGGHQAIDGLFQRRAHGGRRAGLWLRRRIRHRRCPLPHAQPFIEQIPDVLRRREHDACLPNQGNPVDHRCRPLFPGCRRFVAGGCGEGLARPSRTGRRRDLCIGRSELLRWHGPDPHSLGHRSRRCDLPTFA
jgi:formate hydrogenlyase subunit 4